MATINAMDGSVYLCISVRKNRRRNTSGYNYYSGVNYKSCAIASVFAGILGETNQYAGVAFCLAAVMAAGFYIHYKMFDGYEECGEAAAAKKKKEDVTKTKGKDLVNSLVQNPSLIFLLLTNLSDYIYNFIGYHILPPVLYGVRMLYGAELNILDSDGNVDLPEMILKEMDLCIASYHTVCTRPGTKGENTRAYLNAMENPYVHIIGHPDDGNIPVDFEELVLGAKKNNVLLEVNNSSLKTADYRLNTRENLITMLRLCECCGVCVSVGSDAHFADSAGNLKANTSVDKFTGLLKKRKEMRA